MYTTRRIKRLKNKLGPQRSAPEFGQSNFLNLYPSGSKIMLMIQMSCSNIENDFCALNSLKYIIFIPQFTTNELGKYNDYTFQKWHVY